jgi:hypothetical protein
MDKSPPISTKKPHKPKWRICIMDVWAVLIHKLSRDTLEGLFLRKGCLPGGKCRLLHDRSPATSKKTSVLG